MTQHLAERQSAKSGRSPRIHWQAHPQCPAWPPRGALPRSRPRAGPRFPWRRAWGPALPSPRDLRQARGPWSKCRWERSCLPSSHSRYERALQTVTWKNNGSCFPVRRWGARRMCVSPEKIWGLGSGSTSFGAGARPLWTRRTACLRVGGRDGGRVPRGSPRAPGPESPREPRPGSAVRAP